MAILLIDCVLGDDELRFEFETLCECKVASDTSCSVCMPVTKDTSIYRPRSLAKQGDNALGCVRASICLSLCVLCPFILKFKFEEKNDHYQSEELVCVSVIRGLMRKISQMWSFSFEYDGRVPCFTRIMIAIDQN